METTDLTDPTVVSLIESDIAVFEYEAAVRL
jgi:hypothetical protein